MLGFESSIYFSIIENFMCFFIQSFETEIDLNVLY